MNRKIVLFTLLAAGVAAAQTIVHSFDGDSGPGLAACQSGSGHCDRPEMDVAANGKQVVQVTWQNVRIYDYNGRLLKSTPMPDFIRSAGLDPTPRPRPNQNPPPHMSPYEPHVVYDEFLGRWIVSVTCLNDCVLVSASSDAGGSWGGVYLSCLQGGPCLDFDVASHVGYDKNGVYDCGAHLGDENPHTVPRVSYDCFAIPAAEVPGMAKGTPPAHINRVHNFPLDAIPAIDHNRSKSASAPALFMAKTCDRSTQGGCQNAMHFPFEWLVDTFTWNGVTGTYNAGGEQTVKTDVGSKANKWLYSKPCCGPLGAIPQAGNDTIQLRVAESHRLMNIFQFGSHLQGVLGSGPCTKDCGSQGADTNNILIWVDLDCSKPTACIVSRTEKISGPDFNPELATVGVDAAGNTGIVADSATASTDLSILLWTHPKGDGAAFSGPTMVIAGTQPYTCLNTRNTATIGNAAGVLTALDPSDGTKLWTTEQWSDDAARCVWKTRIIEYEIAGSGRGSKSRASSTRSRRR